MKSFKKYFSLPAPADEVYLALTNPKSIMLWSGDWAVMSEVAGSEFSLWDGSIVGKNLAFETNKKIVQQWYFGEDSDDSIVTIKLHENSGKTSMEVEHTNIPDDAFKDIVDGWNNNYFAGLLEFFEE
jgi:activator of HSP90 ATPase